MALTANSFSKCAPNLSTNIKQCGSVTICNAIPLQSSDLTSAYMDSGNYRVMEALLMHEMEIKQCEAVQNGLYDFFMANKVNMSKRIQSKNVNTGLIQILPLIEARQYSPINNEYWAISGGTSAGAGDWAVHVTSTTNIPADARSFPVGLRVFADGLSRGGSSTKTAWTVLAVTDNGNDTLTLNLTQGNSASNLPVDKLASPVTGILRRGTPNVNDFEKFCNEPPSYLNWKNVPFWVETTRTSMCKSSLYDQYRKLLLEGNALYREFGDLDDIAKNKQLAADWQKRLVTQMFWGKPLPNQTVALMNDLESIESFDGSAWGLGVDGAKCVGKRANAIGIYEQLAECNRISDLQGGQLNLPALFNEFYNMMRVRENAGQNNARVFDVFTDNVTAELINQAMIKYYAAKSEDQNGATTLRLNMPVEGFSLMKKAEFGFMYRSYPLFFPAGVVMNIVTHYHFDDYLTAAASVGQTDTARVLWILDFSGIYPGILASNRVVAKTGDLKTLASINSSFACVMDVPTQEQTLTSLTWTMIVECPRGNLIIENFDSSVPAFLTAGDTHYPNTTTTTTTAQ